MLFVNDKEQDSEYGIVKTRVKTDPKRDKQADVPYFKRGLFGFDFHSLCVTN